MKAHGANVINVCEQLDLSAGIFRSLKGKESRNVPLSTDLALTLNKWIQLKSIAANGLIFSSAGSPIDHNNFAKRVFNVDIAEWGGKRIKFHGLMPTSLRPTV